MPYAIEMFFDSVTEARIGELWEVLAFEEVTFMRDSGARPHVTLAVCDSLDLAKAQQVLNRFGKTVSPFPIRLASLGLFASEAPVVFLSPKVTPHLLRLHEDFHASFAGVGQDNWEHYAPSEWMPHCTLAMDFDVERIQQVLEICGSVELPINGRVVEMGIVEFRPARQRCSVMLEDTRNLVNNQRC